MLHIIAWKNVDIYVEFMTWVHLSENSQLIITLQEQDSN